MDVKDYVIGLSSRLDSSEATALSMDGEVLATITDASMSIVTVSRNLLTKRFNQIITHLLDEFGGSREQCRCLLVSAAGIDSPKSRLSFLEVCSDAHLLCPIFCLNDGMAALYTATKGEGVLAVSGKGSIAVGRNAEGKITRSGGYPVTVLGNEGSAQWIALHAMHLASQWLDGSVSFSALMQKIDRHFNGLDAEKLGESANALRHKAIDSGLAHLVIEAAEEGDPAAINILKRGANELFSVAATVVQRLDFADQPFLSGLWGFVFRESDIYRNEYIRLVRETYPQSRIVLPEARDSECAAWMALDYLNGKIPYISTL